MYCENEKAAPHWKNKIWEYYTTTFSSALIFLITVHIWALLLWSIPFRSLVHYSCNNTKHMPNFEPSVYSKIVNLIVPGITWRLNNYFIETTFGLLQSQKIISNVFKISHIGAFHLKIYVVALQKRNKVIFEFFHIRQVYFWEAYSSNVYLFSYLLLLNRG